MFRRVATFGSFVCGAFLVIFDLGWIPGLSNQSGRLGTIGIGVGAAFLFGCGIFAWLLFARFVSRAASRLTVTSTGLVAHLYGGATVDLPWLDRDFVAQITVSTAYPTASVFLSVRGSGGQVTARITREGLSLVAAEARQHDLTVEQSAPQKSQQWVEVTTIKHR